MRAKWAWPQASAIHASLLLLWAWASLAAPPPNDTCAGAEIIPPTGPFPYLSSIVHVSEATLAGDPPPPSCRAVNVTNAVWYRFTPATTQLYTLSVGTDTATTVLDTVMSVYTSTSECGGSFTPLFCNDDASGDSGLQSALSVNLSANVTYYVLVWTTTLSPLFTGHNAVQLRVSQPTVPANDLCAGAEIIPATGSFPYVTTVVDTTLATTNGDPPPPSCWNQARRSVWFKFTPDTTATYEFTLCTNTATTIYETLLAIYRAASPCASFTQVACNHTVPCGNKLRSTISTPLTNGVTYYIVGWEGVNDDPILGETLLQLRVSRFLAPVASTLPAVKVTFASATIRASVLPNNLPTTAWFEWGSTTNYGNTTPPEDLGSGNTNVPVNAGISALIAGATYHFRIRATNALGSAVGTNQSFLAALAPSSTTYSAYGLTSTGAVLEAIVSPNAAPTIAYFQYGLTTNYGFTTPPASLGAGTDALHLASAIGGLTSGAQYHFRIVASNPVGASLGVNRSFAWSPLAPRLAVVPGANTQFTLRFRGQPSQLYSLEASTNLVTWSNLGPASELGGEFFEWSGPRILPRQFYRVRLP